jgi:uncharacterized membrane protein
MDSYFQLLHPKLVHFPIALVISAMGAQAFGLFFKKDSWCKSAWIMFILAVLSMPVVVLAGLWEAQRLHLHHPVLDMHKRFAFLAMWLSTGALLVLWLIRHKKGFQIVLLITLIMVSILLGLAAQQGGRMVYEFGVGVAN